MTKLDILNSTVPDLLSAMKEAYKAKHKCVDLALLIARINAAYSKDIAEASYLVAYIRFCRWRNDYKKVLQIREALALESDS